MLMLSGAVPVPEAFCAVICTLKVPDSVGMPLINPVVALTPTPSGSCPMTP